MQVTRCVTGLVLLLAIVGCGKSDVPAVSYVDWEVNNRREDQKHLNKIVQACAVWSNEHSDHFPENLAVLVAEKKVSPDDLLRPGSVTAPLHLSPEQEAAAAKDWHAIEPLVAGHCDYLYFGKGLNNDTDPTQIILVTKPWVEVKYGKDAPRRVGQVDGVCFAFGDTHAEFTKPGDWERVIAISKSRDRFHPDATPIDIALLRRSGD